METLNNLNGADANRMLFLDEIDNNLVIQKRASINEALRSSGTIIAIIGPCALSEDETTLRSEAEQIKQLETYNRGLLMLHRLPPYKPRTNPNDFKGLETTMPDLSDKILLDRASESHNLAIEIVLNNHIMRYGGILSFGWIGARNIESRFLLKNLALQYLNLPIGVKNGLNGSIDEALENISEINNLRINDDGEAVLIYRGGENAQNPESWESNYIAAHQATKGNLIVDLAHGSEMAHTEGFLKSEEGQEKALEHLIILSSKGLRPKGIMLEASDTPRLVDPNMSFTVALNGIKRLLG